MAQAWPRAKELRDLPQTDVKSRLDQLRQDLWHARVKARDGSLQQTHQLRMIRRQIARLQTVLRGKP